jgi:hypothetical protein
LITNDISRKIFGSHISLPFYGHSILVDEIAAEELRIFVKSLNSVGGLCREHTKGRSSNDENSPVTSDYTYFCDDAVRFESDNKLVTDQA